MEFTCAPTLPADKRGKSVMHDLQTALPQTESLVRFFSN